MTAVGKRNAKLVAFILLKGFLLCFCGVVLNLALSQVCGFFNIPLYLDSIGTILASFVGLSLPGIFVGISTNINNAETGS